MQTFKFQIKKTGFIYFEENGTFKKFTPAFFKELISASVSKELAYKWEDDESPENANFSVHCGIHIFRSNDRFINFDYYAENWDTLLLWESYVKGLIADIKEWYIGLPTDEAEITFE